MTAQETNLANAFETTLTVALGPTDLTATVATTTGGPASPGYLVLEPDVPARREFVLFDGTYTGTTFVASNINKRYLAGSAAGSGITHPIGSVVRMAPVAQHFEDLNDRIDLKANLASPTFTGTVTTAALTMADNLLTRPILRDYGEDVSAHGSVTTSATINIESGNVHTITLGGNVTFTFSNPTASGDACSFTLIVLQDATGSRTITWPASVKWAGGTAPTLTTTASRYDVFTFVTVDAGTRWFGFTAGLNFS